MREITDRERETLRLYFDRFDREGAVDYCRRLLTEKTVSVEQLYEEMIAPILNNLDVHRGNEDREIWKEHVKSGIARSIVESIWPFVLRRREEWPPEEKRLRVLIFCPEEEFHELGARMGADFFTMVNCDVVYIGCNTPHENVYEALETLNPDIVVVSVSGGLNLVHIAGEIAEIRQRAGKTVKIVLAGGAFLHVPRDDFQADAYIRTFRDVAALKEACR